MAKPGALVRYTPTGLFAEEMLAACFKISAADHTRRAYWADARSWLEFCDLRGVDPKFADATVVAFWMESLRKEGKASKTRARRISALSSIYNRLRRDQKLPRQPNGDPATNPFSIADGPEREDVTTLIPTPQASASAVQAAIAVCGTDPEGIRDEALMRILWKTGMRRKSIVSMTFERLQPEGGGFIAAVVGKKNKPLRVYIDGRAAELLRSWLTILRSSGIERGPIWRDLNGNTLVEKDIWRRVRHRAKQAGVDNLSPHMFRVSFLTLCPADLAAKQDAAGHSDPHTTRQYDRNWHGRTAFEAMPEIEDAVETEDAVDDLG